MVIAIDDSARTPVSDVGVRVHRPGRFVSESHWEPQWQGFTDSGGSVQLKGIPAGRYTLSLCSGAYKPTEQEILIRPGGVDTTHASLHYLGPPRDGRRCEVRFIILPDSTLGNLVVIATEWETGRPVSFGNVLVLGEYRGAMTDETGVGAVKALTPGLKRVKLVALGRLAVTDSVRIVSGSTTTIRVRLKADPVKVEP